MSYLRSWRRTACLLIAVLAVHGHAALAGKNVAPAFAVPERRVPDPGKERPHYVYDISLHSAAELTALLKRLQKIAGGPRSGGQQPEVALVLHGPEIRFFVRDNYSVNRELVDLAARLDAFGVIEVKMCQTRMRSLDIEPDQIPGFIEQVPFGPAEIERLKADDYVYM